MSDPLGRPLRFSPIYKEKIWGGQAFRRLLGRTIPETTPVGESWEISGYGPEQSRVTDGGELENYTLGQIMKMAPRELLGSAAEAKTFPLLYKFIDAHDRLSVQVHPDDTQARGRAWGEYGKTECWYVVDAQPDAGIIVGFKEPTTRQQIAEAVAGNRLDQLLNRVPIASGDVLYVPAGTVHAILEGTLIYEVQETSDTTLRLYDWGRTDTEGKPRDLQVGDALEVIDTIAHNRHRIEQITLDKPGFKRSYRMACRYFALEQYTFSRELTISLDVKQSFKVVTVIGETVRLACKDCELDVPKGSTVLLPAGCKEIDVSGVAGSRFLLSYIPDLTADIIRPLRDLGVPDETIALLGGNPGKNDLIPLL